MKELLGFSSSGVDIDMGKRLGTTFGCVIVEAIQGSPISEAKMRGMKAGGMIAMDSLRSRKL